MGNAWWWENGEFTKVDCHGDDQYFYLKLGLVKVRFYPESRTLSLHGKDKRYVEKALVDCVAMLELRPILVDKEWGIGFKRFETVSLA